MGEELPGRPARAAAPRRRRRLPVLAQPARRRLPPRQQHPRRPRHRRQHHADGLRQPRRHLGHRRLLHPQPVHRRARSCTASSCVNAQGEDVVAGIRTPRPLAEMEDGAARGLRASSWTTMERLEQHYGDMQDIEFTVEQGTLYLLQTRTGKRTAQAAIKVASDLVAEGVIDRRRGAAPDRARRSSTSCCTRPSTRSHEHEPLTTGLNASPGAAVGAVVFDADTAEQRGRAGEARRPGALGDHPGRHPRRDRRAGRADRARRHDLARGRRRPRHGQALRGRLRRRSRSTSTRARIRPSATRCSREGDTITLDGSTGQVFAGRARWCRRRSTTDFEQLVGWADDDPPPRRARQRRHAGGRAQGPGVRRRGHRPVPHRAHVHGRGAACRRCGG